MRHNPDAVLELREFQEKAGQLRGVLSDQAIMLCFLALGSKMWAGNFDSAAPPES